MLTVTSETPPAASTAACFMSVNHILHLLLLETQREPRQISPKGAIKFFFLLPSNPARRRRVFVFLYQNRNGHQSATLRRANY